MFDADVINEYFQEDHIMDRDGIILEIEKRKFHSTIRKKSMNVMRERVISWRRTTGNSYYDDNLWEAMEIDLDEIQVMQYLGTGSFAKVYLVQDEDPMCDEESLYAVKAIDRI